MTSKKSKAVAEKIDEPFEDSLLQRAKKIAATYKLTIERCVKGGFVGSSVELPNVTAGGSSISECAVQTEEALITMIAFLIERGRPLPVPLSQQARTEQVNVRLTPAEKQTLERHASEKGFRGVSEYIRSASLRE